MKKIIVFGKHYEKIHSVRSVCKIIKIILTMTPVEKSKKPISEYNKAISTKIDLKETKNNKACTRVICKKSYGLIRFLWSSKVHTCEYGHGRDTSKVRVDNKTIHVF